MNCVWVILCLAIVFVKNGNGIICYWCHQTTKECNNGNLGDVNQKNCSEDRCALIKYETAMPGRKVLATIRDCALYTEQELIKMISPDMQKPATIILFEECDTPLCNISSRKISFSIVATIVLCFVLYTFR